MCGRFVAATPGAALKQLFDLVNEPEVVARYNVAPGQPVLAVRHTEHGKVGANVVWGYRLERNGKRTFVINARSETAALLPSFRDDLRARRVIVPADGWYEWKKASEGDRGVPHLVRPLDGKPMGFAGLWRPTERAVVEAPADAVPAGPAPGELVILTTPASRALGWLHDRMPGIISLEDADAWLDPRVVSGQAALALLQDPNDLLANAARVSERVNKVANEDPECAAPLS